MPTIVQLNDVFRADFISDLGTQIAVNSLHYRVTSVSAPNPSDQDIANRLSEVIGPLYRAYMPVLANYRGVRLTKVNAPLVPYVTSELQSGAGTIAGDPLPTQTALLISLKTPLSGRSFRGRVYLPFWPEGSNDILGEVDDAAILKANQWAAAALASVVVGIPPNASTVQAGVFSRTLAQWTGLSGQTFHDKWATQRRRSQINRGDALPI